MAKVEIISEEEKDDEPRRTRINKKKEEADENGRAVFSAACHCFIMIWTVTAHHREKESVKMLPPLNLILQKTRLNRKRKDAKEKTPKSIDRNKQISNYLQQIGFSGTAMIVKDGKVVLKKALAMRTENKKLKQSGDIILYRFFTKALIATAVLQLEEKGCCRRVTPSVHTCRIFLTARALH